MDDQRTAIAAAVPGEYYWARTRGSGDEWDLVCCNVDRRWFEFHQAGWFDEDEIVVLGPKIERPT